MATHELAQQVAQTSDLEQLQGTLQDLNALLGQTYTELDELISRLTGNDTAGDENKVEVVADGFLGELQRQAYAANRRAQGISECAQELRRRL